VPGCSALKRVIDVFAPVRFAREAVIFSRQSGVRNGLDCFVFPEIA
jgi:hypothetical protein